jgi:hypothetical protein
MRTPAEIIDAIRTRVQEGWHHDVAAATATATVGWPCGFELASPTQSELEEDFDYFQSQADEWRAWADERDLELTTSLRRVNGTIQSIPTHLMINDLDTAVRLIGGDWERRLERGRAHAALLERRFPGVAAIASVVRAVDRYSDADFDLLTSTARWFREESDSGLSARELPIEGLSRGWLATNEPLVLTLAGIDSLGLVETDPRRIHFRYLDPDHLTEGGRQHDSATVGDAMRPAYEPDIVLICEHAGTALHIPPLSWAIAVEGAGAGAGAGADGTSRSDASALASFDWISSASHLIYWGDMDAASLETVSGLRTAGLDVGTILMDIPTFDVFERFGTMTDASGAEIMPDSGIALPDEEAALAAAAALALNGPSAPRPTPALLTEPERLLYERLTDPQWTGARRIEQERIPLAEAAKALAKVLSARVSAN